jgi:type IV pilus assembly protein PilF
MSRHRTQGLLFSLIACLLLAACTGSAFRSGGGPDDLDEGGKERPGDIYVKLAVEYLRQGQTETALRKANQALDKDPDNAQAHNVIALIYQRLRKDELAEQHFRKATSLQPQDPYVLNAYASFLCDRRKFADAEAHYKKALASPYYSTPWVATTNMGTCAKRSGNGNKAETYFRDALSTNPSFGPALGAMADLEYSRGRSKSARTYLDRYFKVAQPTPQVLLLAVRVERKLGSRKRSKTYAQMLRKSYPNSPEARQL